MDILASTFEIILLNITRLPALLCHRYGLSHEIMVASPLGISLNYGMLLDIMGCPILMLYVSHDLCVGPMTLVGCPLIRGCQNCTSSHTWQPAARVNDNHPVILKILRMSYLFG